MQNRDKIKNIVVVTHSAPREDLLPETNDNTFNLLNGSFCNTRLEDVLEVDYNSKIRVWCYGHTHFRKDAVIDGVRYVNNCLGYPHEQQGEMWQFKQIHT
jgi:predicted phosphodiesterase